MSFLFIKCKACGKYFETSKGLSIHIGKIKDHIHNQMKTNGSIKKADEFENLSESLKNETESLKNEIKTKIVEIKFHNDSTKVSHSTF